MESGDISKTLDMMVSRFTKMEQKKKENDPKYIEWIEKISEKEYGLIPNLLVYFLDELTTQEDKEKIFKVFQKLMQLNSDTITEQLLNNTDFPKAVVQYIIKENKEKMSDSAFFLITKLFRESNFKSFINQDFMEAMFNGLNIVHEEEVLLGIVGILVDINSNYINTDDNLFIDEYKKNPNSRVLNELLLRLLNNENDREKTKKILLCLNKLMEVTDNKVFYESDLQSFIDILLNIIQSTSDPNLKMFLIDGLEKATRAEAYFSEKYKDEEIVELMADIEQSDEESKEIKEFAQKITQNVVRNEK